MKHSLSLRSRFAFATALSTLALSVSAQVTTIPSSLTSPADPTISSQTASPPRLDPVIVTATRVAEPLQVLIGDNSVVTRAEIDAMPGATLGDVLGRQRGIAIVNSGGPQNLTTINMRGTNSNQTLVLIDGVRINNGSNGLPALNAVPTNAIERIEIVRGAASSLYGADAIGGVVNIITRQEEGDQPFSAYATAGVGTYDSSEYTAGLSGSQNNWRYNLYGGYGQSAGFNASSIDNFYFNPDQDSYYRSNFGGTLSYEWSPDQTLTLQTLQSRVNGGYDFGAPYFSDRAIQVLNSTSISSRNQINLQWTSSLTAALMVDKAETFTLPSAGDDGRDTFKTQQTQFTWQNDFKLTDAHTAVLGVERLEQKVSGTIGYDSEKVFTNSIFAGFDGSWGIHAVQASLRNDHNSQYSNFVSASLNYAIDLTENWRASIGGSTGFRAPNFNELFWPQTSSFVGNPNLQPEKSRNLEAGLRYLLPRGEIAATAYWNQITDAIVNEPTSAGSFVFTPVNIGKAKIRGFTLSGHHEITNSLTVGGSFDWLSAINSETNKSLPLRAQRVLKLDAAYQVQSVTFDAQWFLTSNKKEVFSDKLLDGYGLVDLGVAYDWNQNTTLRLRWNNVFNKSYNLIDGYNTTGSNVFVNLTLRY
jgi:vitamin B12 transporter